MIASLLSLLLYFQGLNLLELAAHLEEKAAQLRHEGLGQIKIALAGTDRSSLLEILQGHFQHIDSSESNESENVSTAEEETPRAIEKISAKPTEAANLATAHLVFPFKFSPLLLLASLKCIYLSVAPRPYLSVIVKSLCVPLISPKNQQPVTMSVMTISMWPLLVYTAALKMVQCFHLGAPFFEAPQG